jgi:hypothetical protein
MVMGSLTKIPESLSLEYRDSSGIKVIFQNFKNETPCMSMGSTNRGVPNKLLKF